ncbi:restriction endonuclease subunit S [Hymenobacter sp. BT523]|uniref:restriction endonuclease subunit S n=1 Tax=Hymenobacter sp. BT523 TaxID=2795725 RepID=UPI0018EA609B|nr:restriction endonuclease subunit S [Hymenobacter sp. BT523]MBJ6111786.1 restriction endonuclease subunit S [Hymenobacter sp. BT523]
MQLELYNQAIAPDEAGQRQPLSKFLTQRKVFITIDDTTEYKRCRVQSNRKGVVLRDIAKGAAINTKKQQLCQPGDFLVAEIDAKVGGYGFVPAELDGAIVSSHYYLFEVDEAQLLSRYLYYLAQSDIIQSQISSQGSTNYAAIRPKEFLAIEIPYVEPEEQRAIVARLDALTLESDEFGQEAAHQTTLLTRLREAILREAVQGRLLPQDPTDEPAPALLARIRAEKHHLIKEKKLRAEKPLPPLSDAEVPYGVPEGWVWCRLGQLVLKSEAGKSLTCYPYPASYPKWGIIKVSAMSWGTFDETESKELPEEVTPELAYQIMPGDYLISRANTGELIGRSVLVGEIKANLLLSDKSIRMIFAEDVNKEYISLCNAAEYTRTYYKSVATGTSDSMKNLSREQMYALAIPLPPLAEQRRIVAKVAELLAHCTELEAELGQARAAASALHAAALREAFRPVAVAAVA